MSHRAHAQAASTRVFVAAMNEDTLEGLQGTSLNLSRAQQRQIRDLRRAFRSVN